MWPTEQFEFETPAIHAVADLIVVELNAGKLNAGWHCSGVERCGVKRCGVKRCCGVKRRMALLSINSLSFFCF